MNLSGKVLVVTGSDGALGQAAAENLSGYGARLALLSHAPPAAQSAAELKDRGITVTSFLVSDEARAVTGALIPAVGRV